MTPLSDLAERERFATELGRNFSVLASAGSGKTYAITRRILAMAQSASAIEWLPQLVVVTFTNRAADEMQQRSRQRLLEAGLNFDVMAAFDRAFFGTIHSFCVRLLRAHGHALGLPARTEVITDDGPLWRAFLQRYTRVGTTLSEAVRKRFFRHIRVGDVLALGRHCAHELRVETPDDTCEELDYAPLLDFVASRRSAANVARSQKAVREWLSVMQHTDEFAPLPSTYGQTKAFVAQWNATFAPLHEWLQRVALCVACETARAFREFRLKRGALTYDDQVALARELLRRPEVARRIREKKHRVILDEAQDTDPEQFALLAEVARSPDAEGEWPEEGEGPRPGHFCMVGDLQQSIYGSRADLDCYRRIHEALTHAGVGEALTFSATFRLDEAPLALVNQSFHHILTGSEGQVPFVPLAPRSDVLPGQVVRVNIPFVDARRDWERAWHEARIVANWIRATGLEALRAPRWSDVAIICPRKGWFPTLRATLRGVGIAAQLQSDKEIRGDHPSVAWFTALVVVLAEPENSFEIVGVLREVFGVSDHDLAEFSNGKAECFTLLRLPTKAGPVSDILKLLSDLRTSLEGKALLAQANAILSATRLRDRLLSLPQEEYEWMDETLDDLLVRVAAAEADGLTLFQMAERLRAEYETSRESRPVEPDSIQVITGHKAKGSEWPVVILPFFARYVGTIKPPYPLIYRDAHDQTRVAFSKTEVSRDAADAMERRARHEAERLLYVAMTRAKHTLVIIDDRELFATKEGLPKFSQANLFKATSAGENAPVIAGLSTVAEECAETRHSQQKSDRLRADAGVLPLAPLDAQSLTTARDRATQFIKRNPSALHHEVPADPTKAPEPEALAMAADPVAVHYGTWWHDLMETLDWSAPATWQTTFDAEAPNTPDPERAATEWPLFLEKVAGRAEITAADLIFHPEMPFLWRTSDHDCIEGIADLVVFDPAARSWFVVDWKTNLIEPRHLLALRDQYRGQLAAYRAAFQAMLGAPVSAALYSTSTGEWLAYDDAALDQTWLELSRHPEALEAALLA